MRGAAAAAVLAMALAGCGSDDASTSGRASKDARATLRAALLHCDEAAPTDPASTESCMTKAIESAEPELGLQVVPIARKAVASTPRLEGACHMAMHPIGEAAITRHSAREALAVVDAIEDSQCDTGFVHGVLVGAAKAPGDDALDGIIAACDREQDPAGQAGCVHGLGHVARRRTDSVRAAVDFCRDVASDRAADCTLGLFHDLQLAVAGSESGGPAPSAGDRAFAEHASACAALVVDAATSCTWRLGMERGATAWPTGIASATTSARAAFGIRRTCGEPIWHRTRAACVTGIIRALRGPGGGMPDSRQLVATCDLLPTTDSEACAHGLFDLSPQTRAQSAAACASANPAVQVACGWWIGHLGAMGIERTDGHGCDDLAPTIARGCDAGARETRTLGVV